MGVVYRGFDLALERPVALKILAPELAADVRFRERFLRESRLAASIDHPNVIPVYDAGEVGGELYLAMRYVDGSDLRCVIADGRLGKERTISVVSQVAAALDAAHVRGLVHRDVKPSNVLVGESDHVYLADFGLTRQLGESAAALGAAQSMGTPDYVSPEQIRGDEVDGRADLYSLGCVLQECLTGEPPFRRPSQLATLFAHLEAEPAEAPAGLEPVMRTALAKEPDERYQSGRELVEAARAALGLEPRRSRWPLAVAAVGLAFVGAALLAFFLTRGTGGLRAEPGADSLVRIDPKTNKTTEAVPVGRDASGIAVGGNHVWVTSFADGNVWRVDPRTRATLRISTQGSPTGVAFGAGQVVVANGPQHSLAVIDATTATLSFAATLPGTTSGVLRVGGGRGDPWFADPDQRIAGEVTDALSSGGPSKRVAIVPDESNFVTAYRSFDGLAVGGGAVWVIGDYSERALWRIDPNTGRIASRVRLPVIPAAVAAGNGAVWVTSLLDDTVSRIDPATGRSVATIRVGRGAGAIAAGENAVWVVNSIDGTVSRIDPSSNRVAATIPVGVGAGSIAVDSSGVWVTTAPSRPTPVPSGGIRIGVLSDCAGPFGQTYDLTLAAAELPLIERGARLLGPGPEAGVEGATVAGRPVELFFGCANGVGESALSEARRLVESVGVDVLIGPVTAEEELPLQEYARRHRNVAFLNGPASMQLIDPASNFFSYHSEGAQWMAGLGAYAYKTLGWRTAVVVADEQFNPFSWSQSAGFVAEFCSLGGKIVKRIWIPPGTTDFSGVVAQIPTRGVGGLMVASGEPAVIALAHSRSGLDGDPKRRMIIGQEAQGPGLAPLGARISDLVTGGPTGTSLGGSYLDDFRKVFPRLGKTFAGGVFDLSEYADVEATLRALTAVHADLSDGERRFMAALGKVELDLPNGRLTLDADHQAIAPNYILQFESPFQQRVIRTVPAVERTFNGYFTTHDPPPNTTTPACVKRTPPPWAR
jgi:YVTN family beta-propeller protein